MSPIALSDVPNRLSPTSSPEIAMYLSVMIFYQWKVETNIQNQNIDIINFIICSIFFISEKHLDLMITINASVGDN